jgi:L-aspartate oxidase
MASRGRRDAAAGGPDPAAERSEQAGPDAADGSSRFAGVVAHPGTLTAPRSADVIIVGGGVAGLAAALALRGKRVLLVSKRQLGWGGASVWAQGGVAVAMAAGDSPALHAADTEAVAGGIADRAAVALLTRRGPERVQELLALGAEFDRGPGGELSFGREAAHSAARILHAGGDATGAEMVRTLVAAVRAATWIEQLEDVFVEDLLVDGGRVVGMLARDRQGTLLPIGAGAVILATGGIGQAYRYTTNPPEATGDGLAMAARAGAVLADLEFVQFHPTALVAPEDPLPLLTEALRGEGAILVDGDGERFMLDEHPLAELAPRDIVARAIWRRRAAGAEVFLDARAAVGGRFPDRFPTVFARCQGHGIDPRVDLLPVTPAAHYHMGGIAVDLAGRSSLPGLLACGEVASNGLHGANRLASNSLLEALVYGSEAGQAAAKDSATRPGSRAVWRAARRLPAPAPAHEPATDSAVRARTRELLWQRGGLLRDEAGLLSALDELGALATGAPAVGGETRNLLLVARLVTAAALRRRESRGAHHRIDHPELDPAAAQRSLFSAAELGIAADGTTAVPARRAGARR